MKFPLLVFLCALVVISHQQLQRPRGMMVWLSPYSLLQPAITNYQTQYYTHPDDESLSLRNLHIAYSQKDELNKDQMVLDSQHLTNENDYTNPQSRFKGFYQTLVPQNARFFFGNGIANPFLMRIATFTVTSTLNVTSVQPCIPILQFTNVASTNPCRRRKRQTLESFDGSEDIQFPIKSSEAQKVIPTVLSPLMKENRLLDHQTDSGNHAGIISSKDDIFYDQTSTLKLPNTNLREKRFLFNNQIASTTVTQYSIFSTVSIRTISPGAAAASLFCLPPSMIVCPNAAG